MGQDCFRTTWIVLAVLNVVSTACALALYHRKRDVYRWHVRQLTSYDEEVQRDEGRPASLRSV
jgi:hypothetical protein